MYLANKSQTMTKKSLLVMMFDIMITPKTVFNQFNYT